MTDDNTLQMISCIQSNDPNKNALFHVVVGIVRDGKLKLIRITNMEGNPLVSFIGDPLPLDK
jgi:hypothetical protein